MISRFYPWALAPQPASHLFSPNTHHHSITYDHIRAKIRDPVRSPLVKRARAESVVGSVTTSESSVLYVFVPFWWSLVELVELKNTARGG